MNSSLKNSSENILRPLESGILFFLENLGDYLPYTSLAIIATITGAIGNLLIIGAVITTKELQTTSNIFVVNLAIADFLISCLIDSFTAVGVFTGEEFFTARPGLCPFIAALCLITCEASLMSIGFIALNRYIKICRNHLYAKWFTRNKTIIYCIITWIIGVLIDVPNFSGWSNHYYDHKTLNCMWNRLSSQSYSIFFPMTSIIAPCCIILFLYIKIFIYAVRVKSRVNTNADRYKTTLRIAKGLFTSYIIFALCWLPYGLIVMIDFQNKLPRSAHMYSMLLAHLNSSLNPIVYAISNPLFQTGYKNLFKILLCNTKTIQTKGKANPVFHSTSKGINSVS